MMYLDDLLMDIQTLIQTQVNEVSWALKQLMQNCFLTNLKKCRFHQNNVRILRFVVSVKCLRMNKEKFEIVKGWSEPKLIPEIIMFLESCLLLPKFDLRVQ